jgi:hypothetical protein
MGFDRSFGGVSQARMRKAMPMRINTAMPMRMNTRRRRTGRSAYAKASSGNRESMKMLTVAVIVIAVIVIAIE